MLKEFTEKHLRRPQERLKTCRIGKGDPEKEGQQQRDADGNQRSWIDGARRHGS
jgi:hypothetical protein